MKWADHLIFNNIHDSHFKSPRFETQRDPTAPKKIRILRHLVTFLVTLTDVIGDFELTSPMP